MIRSCPLGHTAPQVGLCHSVNQLIDGRVPDGSLRHCGMVSRKKRPPYLTVDRSSLTSNGSPAYKTTPSSERRKTEVPRVGHIDRSTSPRGDRGRRSSV
jgi:hypothetical protein